MIKSDGTRVPVELTSVVRPDEGPVKRAFVVFRDITERRIADAALRDRDEQLRQAQKMEAVGRLAGGIALPHSTGLRNIPLPGDIRSCE